ncbi:proto-oncogene Mas-like [Anolis sagrei]|uniref:proto-oncogene Mas-like n=1 Tax=Anolis sagrei TaxID=38937 RepID=UPI00351FFA03
MQRNNFYFMDKENQNFGELRNGTCNSMICNNVDACLRLNDLVLQSITIFICTVGLVETGVVIWFLSLGIQKVNSVTTYFLNLAVADFGILTFLLVFAIHSVHDYLQEIPACPLPLKTAAFHLFLLAYTTALYLLTVVSMERLLTVYFPIWYHSHRPKQTSAIVSCMIWAVSGLLSGTIVLLHYFWSYESSINMIRIICSGNFLVVTLLVTVSTVTRFIKICSQQNAPKFIYVTVPLILICFILFAIPISLFYFIEYLGYSPPSRIMLICFLLASFNSTMNPVIYYVIGGQWKRWGWKRTTGCVPKCLALL